MKKLFLIALTIMICAFSQAQSPTSTDSVNMPDERIFMVPDYQAEYKGGQYALSKFLRKNLEYPNTAKADGIHGQVFVSFVIEKNGSITDIQIVKGVQSDCDKEAIRLISIMPPWLPGRTRSGEKVRVRYVMPIRF